MTRKETEALDRKLAFWSATKDQHAIDKRNAELVPELLAALEGAEKALIKALPHLPADSEAVYCGEWISEIRATIAKAKGGA